MASAAVKEMASVRHQPCWKESSGDFIFAIIVIILKKLQMSGHLRTLCNKNA
jgi:hypothetical protein